MKLSIPRSMEAEGGTSADGAAETATKRKAVSKRNFLKADGSVAEKIEEAAGAQYTLLDPAGNHDFNEQFGTPGQLVTMCAIFGFHTKVGNVANTVLNDKDEPGTPADAAGAIRDFIAQAKAGTWAERTAGGVGARVDKDALAAAICEVAAANGKSPDPLAIRQRLEDEPQYVRMARQVPAVAQAYSVRVGKATKSIDDLLG